MLNSLEIVIIIAVISGTFIAFSIVAFFVMIIVGCIQKRNKDRRPCHDVNRIQTRELEIQEQDNGNEENGEAYQNRILSQAPPPAYRNVSQYQNVDLEHTEVVRTEEAYRITTHMEPETTSLPPDYTSQRMSISVAPQEEQAPEGQLPPTYSTAQLALMARKAVTE
jgi:hypothetical protein